MSQVLLWRPAIDEDIIQIADDKVAQVLPEIVIHHPLEGTGGTLQPKGHHEPLVVSKRGAEGSLMYILFSDPHLPVSGSEINLGEASGFPQLIQTVLDSRKG
eukprot:3223145-Prymnesium_polylepis.1